MAIKFLKEAISTARLSPGPDVIPSSQETKKFAEMYVDYKVNGAKAQYNHLPWNFVRVTKDSAKKMHRFILGVIVGWSDLTTPLSQALLKDGYTKDEIKACLSYVASLANFNWIIEELNNNIKSASATYGSISGGPNTTEALEEDIEKHDELNPKLFDGDKLKPEVREKMLAIVDEFTAGLEEKQIGLEIEDILFLGSNASYNYTKDSDIDLHIVVNAEKLDCSKEIADALYGAFRTIFNKNIEIDFYGIPVELYVEFTDSNRVSNGIYSVQNDEWIKEPVAQDIPEVDMDAFKADYETWEAKCKDIKENAKNESSVTSQDIETLINDIYEQRKQGLTEGEYSIGNLIFKELRNVGLLDELKELKNEVRGKELSLKESVRKRISFKK